MASTEGDNVIDLFDNWFKHYTEVTNHLAEVEENFKIATLQIDTLTKSNARLQSAHCKKQFQIAKNICKLYVTSKEDITLTDKLLSFHEDEVQHLKQKIAEKEQALLNQSAQNTTAIDKVKQDHQNEQESLLANMKAEYDSKLAHLDCQLKLETEANHSLQSQLEDMKKEKDKEVAKITMEYESKLIKAHRQKSQYIQQQQQILNQDVLRKKMQHMKENYEAEIAALKTQIQDLKHMLELVHQGRPGKDHDDHASEQQQPKLQPQKLYLQDTQPPRQRGHQDQRNISKFRSTSKNKL